MKKQIHNNNTVVENCTVLQETFEFRTDYCCTHALLAKLKKKKLRVMKESTYLIVFFIGLFSNEFSLGKLTLENSDSVVLHIGSTF